MVAMSKYDMISALRRCVDLVGESDGTGFPARLGEKPDAFGLLFPVRRDWKTGFSLSIVSE